ncbi:MAG: phospholipid carrier-dependent glycosyltransferase [Planctomyces sp.]|nr:phospholipid carrier-dependent glycosyltransferase [Planctomyces sp.]
MPSSQSPDHKSRLPLLLVAAAVWIAGFLWVFFRQQFPNNPQFHRSDVWGELADELLAGFQSDIPGTPPVWTKQGLQDRLPPVLQAAMLLIAAWGAGSAATRLLCTKIVLARSEQIVFQFGSGLSLIATWIVFCGLCGWLNPVLILSPGAAAFLLVLTRKRSDSNLHNPIVHIPARELKWTRAHTLILTTVMLPFAAYLLLGSLTPSSDFDVREYHLQGPKEWFQAGRIFFLRHNVYTSFPFLSEMLSLGGMVLTNDARQGALTGQFVLATFGLLTTLAVYCIARRIGGTSVALLAALIHLTTPWTLRISIIALAEGALTFYGAATMLCLIILLSRSANDQPRNSIDKSGESQPESVVDALSPAFFGLLGLLAGSCMACKYTGLISVAIPSVALVAWSKRRILLPSQEAKHFKALLAQAAFFTGGFLLITGPWLGRNLFDTGNPVYPLADSIFQSPEWNQEISVRWKPAHAPNEHNVQNLPRHFMDFAVRNDWTSGLLFALFFPGLLYVRRSPALAAVTLMAAWHFFTWWAFTHRIDRFWVPAIPFVAVTGAMAWNLSRDVRWRWFLICAVVISTVYNIQFCRLPLIGFHSRLMPLAKADREVIRSDFQSLNQSLPANSRVLMVGEAEVFDVTFPVVYNTVFDDSIFEQWCADPSNPNGLRSADDIRAILNREHITHVFVNWNEILRYRLPGSYGYTPWVQPSRFRQLTEAGVLADPQLLSVRSWSEMTEQERETVMSWDEHELLRSQPDKLGTIWLFEVH